MLVKFKKVLFIVLGSILSFSLFYLLGFLIAQVIFR